MLVYTKGFQKDTNVTLTESVTLSNPYFLFVFTNVSTKEVVKVIVNSADDISSNSSRVNTFEIDVTLFANATAGQWNYEVYEQTSSTNLDTNGLNILEVGKMILKESSEIVSYSTGYSPQTKFI